MSSIDRRTFLTGVTAAAASGAQQTPRPTRAIDAHTHFYDPTRPQGVPWPGKQESILYQPRLPKHFLSVVKPFNVFGTVVIEASPWLEDNQWVLDLAKDNPVIVGLAGHLNPGTVEFKDHVARFSKNPLFRGIRTGGNLIVAPKNPRLRDDDLKRMADADWELDFAGNSSNFEELLRIVDRIPQLRVVIGHLPWDWPEGQTARASAAAALRELGSRPQVYAKISNVIHSINDQVRQDLAFYRPALDEVYSYFGPDKLIFASNWPVSDMFSPYAAVFRLMTEYFAGKGPDAVEKFFWKNSKAAYKWIQRG